ncbi:MAG: hypothetical protein WBA97_32765 [Actinophytocola sp.]|uniref:hypothetical protein n=1 Tax=Actinophytocola sp. TaxID=1872138 RepID=UPI003C7776EB
MINGRWELVAVAAAEFIAVGYDDGYTTLDDLRLPIGEFNRRWLAGEVLGGEPPFAQLTGLTLTVDGAAFTETGAAEVPWFDDEGVLEPEARPFDGTLATSPSGVFLLTEEGRREGAFADAKELHLRCDDGDTAISDLVTVEDDELRRTMSVITDEMYPSRIRLTYRRG